MRRLAAAVGLVALVAGGAPARGDTGFYFGPFRLRGGSPGRSSPALNSDGRVGREGVEPDPRPFRPFPDGDTAGRGFRVLPPPRVETKTGPLSLGDLHLMSDHEGGFRGERPGYKFHIRKDGTVDFQDRPSASVGAVLFFITGVGIAGGLDLTDLLFRMHGKDPYSYDKGRVLELTAAMREELAGTDRARVMNEALRQLPRRLADLWRRADLSAEARRALLFQLWDELADGPFPEGEGASRARALILTFVRRELPAGSAQAFTAEELERFSRERRSPHPFAPYQSDAGVAPPVDATF